MSNFRILLAPITCLLCLLPASSQTQPQSRWTAQMEAQFQARVSAALEKLAGSNYGSTEFENEKKSYPKAMSDFIAGNREQALAFLQSEDANAQSHAHTRGIDFYSGFTLKGQIRKYFYFGKELDPAYKQRMYEAMRIFTLVDPLTRHFPEPRQFWQGSTDNCTTWVDCRDTDNLRAMRETSVYLMAEETGNENTRLLYKGRIKRFVRSLYQIGQGEWDSENYLGHTITTYINLYDFAQDAEVKSLAASALDWFCTTGAVKYWRGGFGGPSKRDTSNGNQVWGSLATHELGLYFGDSPVEDPKPHPDLVHLITSSYRPPVSVVALARRQFNKPVELLSSKPTYENWLPGGDAAPQFYETLYFGHTFQLGTLATGSGGDWNGFKMMAYNSRRGVDYFIAATGTDPAKMSTSSVGGDNIAQYRNLVIWLNDQPRVPFQFFLPLDALIETKGGVTFIRYEKTWLALWAINLEISGIKESATQKIRARYPNNQILSAAGTGQQVSGFALEIGEGETHGNFEQFQRSVLKHSRLHLNQMEKGMVEYQGVVGRVKLQYQGERSPKVWRNGRYHSLSNHDAVYQGAEGSAAPISLGWKEGRLQVEAGGHQFTRQP